MSRKKFYCLPCDEMGMEAIGGISEVFITPEFILCRCKKQLKHSTPIKEEELHYFGETAYQWMVSCVAKEIIKEAGKNMGEDTKTIMEIVDELEKELNKAKELTKKEGFADGNVE